MKDHHVIDIEDTLKFQQVVRVLDNPYFLEVRDSFRKLIDEVIDEKTVSLKEQVNEKQFEAIIKKLTSIGYKYRKQIFFSNKTKKEVLKIYSNQILDKKFSYQQLNSLFAEIIAKIFRKPEHYKNLIFFSLLRNNITDTDFNTVELKIYHPHFSLPISADNYQKRVDFDNYFDKEISNESLSLFKPPLGISLVMYIHPPFTFEEVKKEFDQKLKALESSLEFNYAREGYDLEAFDVRPNIKRDREWYLDNLSGISYAQIAENEAKKFDGNSAVILGQVTKAIQAYKKFIIYDPKDKIREKEYLSIYKDHFKKNTKIRLIPTIIPVENDPAKKKLYKTFK